MATVPVILIVLAVVLLGIRAFNVAPDQPRFAFGWGGLFLMAAIFHAVDPARYSSGTFHLMSGATFLGAFFIATDYVTSPVSKKGQLVFGLGCGILIWLIRTFAGYPEGMAFAVLLMNGLTPIIDQYTRPRAFGRNSKGEPLPLKEKS